MEESNSNKIFMAFLAGAAIGAAIGYFMNSSRKDELLADLKEGAANLKQGIDDGLDKAKDLVDAFKNYDSTADDSTQPKS
jgi:hypothetical protein